MADVSVNLTGIACTSGRGTLATSISKFFLTPGFLENVLADIPYTNR